MTDPREQAALRDECTVFLTSHGPVRAADLLASIPADTVPDRYGDGGVVAELEAEIAGLLGKPAAVYLPSGTMAQQSVLRVHADRRQRRTVVYHPLCHLDRHEDRAFQRLHGLTGRPAGDPVRLMTADDLTAIAEPPAVLLIELPQRDLGGQQPDWDDLRAQAEWASERGAAAHLDGARLWESAAGYGRPPAEIAALFDTVYVSFYKGIGALAGCCLAGPADILAEVREWRKRMGGTLYGLWPGAASALSCLRRRLPLMPEYLSHAREIAAALREAPCRAGGAGSASGLPDAPAAEHHAGGLRRGGAPAGRRAAHLDLAAGHADPRSRRAAGRAPRRRRHPRPAARSGPRHHRRPDAELARRPGEQAGSVGRRGNTSRSTTRRDFGEKIMASRLNPYLNFNGTARQALEFYNGVFGGELTLSTFADLGAADGPDADKIMHGQLETGAGYTIMAADVPSHMEYQAPAGFAVSLSGDDGDALRGYFEQLAAGGVTAMPLQKQVWGDEFGMCDDKFGISWLVNISQPQA